MLFLSCENKEALSNIIEPHKETHSGQHGKVFLKGYAGSLQKDPHKGPGDAVGKQIAAGNVENKPGNRFLRMLIAAECKILVQEIAQYASKDIITGRGDPVAQSQDVIEGKHDPSSKEGIRNSDQYKSAESAVKEGNKQIPEATGAGDNNQVLLPPHFFDMM